MEKPKILIATAVRNADGSFAIADDEVDILTAYRTLEYGELSGMNAYGKPVTYTETYAVRCCVTRRIVFFSGSGGKMSVLMRWRMNLTPRFVSTLNVSLMCPEP